jgi:hypothetical protein
MVVGLQKSGTSLLMRLLTRSGLFVNPVRWEGREYWGDDPPFTPTAFPTGELYQRYNGLRGHELGLDDASPEIVEHLRHELPDPGDEARALVLKNPYNTVRLPWVRAIFPDAYVVAIVRRPLPNVYSLRKKHIPNEFTTWLPDDGWWGVKPADWPELLREDKVEQCSLQWQCVNGVLARDRELIDMIVPYHDLCDDPAGFVSRIAEQTLGERPSLGLDPIEAQDAEHVHGGPVESANRVVKRTGEFDMRQAERHPDRLPPLTGEQCATVIRVCGDLAAELGVPDPEPATDR